jgi:Na+/H+-dicarboxylate symporter
VKVFKCLSTPVIFLSLIVTIGALETDSRMRKIWRNTLIYTFGSTVIAAFISFLLYLIIHPENLNEVRETTQGALPLTSNYLVYLEQIIPGNIITPFIEQNVLAILLIAILIGSAIKVIPDQEAKKSLLLFFKGLHSLVMILVRWVVTLIPLALYGFITATAIEMKNGSTLKGIGQYLAVILLANSIQGFVFLPLWLKARGIKPFTTMKKMMPALSVAFFSKSSAGTLPITMETAEDVLRLDPKISRFVLPICTSLNMNGCAAFIFVTVTYVIQNQGVTITIPMMFMGILLATIAAVGNAGVPMGCFFLSSAILSSMNIPIHLLGMILPFYSLIDMVETALNVWSDICVATVVNKDILIKPS